MEFVNVRDGIEVLLLRTSDDVAIVGTSKGSGEDGIHSSPTVDQNTANAGIFTLDTLYYFSSEKVLT